MEDDEQYYQMVQLLREFSYKTASGSGLVRRAADFDITPLDAAPAFGEVYFLDDGLRRTYLTSASVAAGSITVSVENAGIFSTVVTPFTARLAEGVSAQEDITVNSVDAVANTITFAAGTLNDHTGLGSSTFDEIRDEFFLGAARISEVDGSPDRAINAGQLVAAPAVGELPEVRFLTTEIGTISNGDFVSDDVSIRAYIAGTTGNVGPLRVISFPTTRPFANAIVINAEATGGGIGAETDTEFAERISGTLASLSRGTVVAIRNYLRQVVMPSTQQRVARLSILEEFVRDPDLPGDGLVRAYIEDGTGSFSAEINTLGLGNLNAGAGAGSGSLAVNITEGEFTSRGWLLIIDIVGAGAANEIVEYSSITAGSPATFNLVGSTTLAHNASDTVLQIEQIDDSTAAGRRFYELDNIAVVENTIQLYKVETFGGTQVITRLVLFDPDTGDITTDDFILNEGKGQIEIFPTHEPIAGSGLFAYYRHYDGLIERAQRTLNGDIRDEINFPGIVSGGVKALVLPAVALVVDVDIELDLLEGFDRTELRERADRVIRSYMTNLEPGKSFIVYEMVERVMGISGMNDLVVNDPLANVIADYDSVIIPGTLRIS